MKVIAILKTATPTKFQEKISETEWHDVLCAFDGDRICSPACAACTISGTDPKAFCNRNGNSIDFPIGFINTVRT